MSCDDESTIGDKGVASDVVMMPEPEATERTFPQQTDAQTTSILAFDVFEKSKYLEKIRNTHERKILSERIRYQQKHQQPTKARRESILIDEFTGTIKEKPNYTQLTDHDKRIKERIRYRKMHPIAQRKRKTEDE